MKAWMRILEVKLTSEFTKSKPVTFGSNWRQGKDDLSISVVGSKYMSGMKDTCTVRISNLTYGEIAQIMMGRYFNVEINVGYRGRSGNVDAATQTIFKGGILYISNSLGSDKSNSVIILCGSELLARFSQQRINFTYNSGINTYAAMKAICAAANIPNSNISPAFKAVFEAHVKNVNASAPQWIEDVLNSSNTIVANTDSTRGSMLTLFDAAQGGGYKINVTEEMINLYGGYPQLTSSGVSLDTSMTFNFCCGDIVKIDNSLIQIPVTSKDQITKNYGYYLDEESEYIVYEVTFNLENRGSNFSQRLLCKKRSLFLGGTT